MEADNYLALILWHKGPRFVIARRPQADVAISGRHCRNGKGIADRIRRQV